MSDFVKQNSDFDLKNARCKNDPKSKFILLSFTILQTEESGTSANEIELLVLSMELRVTTQ